MTVAPTRKSVERTTSSFPFLTTYDPPGTSEGSLDPLGLYRIADQLAVQLVPAVRERMQRIRFLTAMVVGSFVIEDLEGNPRHRDASPYLVWEWLVVEALIREISDDASIRGVPGSGVTRTALAQHGYVDARSYLKTPRIFGFHGVYKSLAVHLGLLDVHLGPGPNAERLADAWARGRGLGGVTGAKTLWGRWKTTVIRSLNHTPPRTNAHWNASDWRDLAQAFAPETAEVEEKRLLRELLLSSGARQLGALPELWRLQANHGSDGLQEEALHADLERQVPAYGPLVEAIRTYEAFARGLQDAFDVLRAEAAGPDARGYVVPSIARSEAFRTSVDRLDERFAAARRALGEITATAISLQNLFDERFGRLAEPMDAQTCALALCEHHETVQRAKSSEGKRPWFDRIGGDRIYLRQAYRVSQPEIDSERYLHGYRGWPIRRFWSDLT